MSEESLFKSIAKDVLERIGAHLEKKSFKKCLQEDIDYEKLLALTTSGTLDEVVYCLRNRTSPDEHTCLSCGKLCQFNRTEYFVSCRSNECLCKILLSNKAIKDKHQYVIDEYLNGDKRFNYIQIGFIEKYHVFSNSQLPGWHDSIVDAYKSKSEEERKQRREKTIKTCRERYGTDFPQQNDEIRKRQSDTWYSKTKAELEEKDRKRKETCIKRYGVDHVMKSSEVVDAAKERRLKKLGYWHWEHMHIEHKDTYLDDEKFKEFIIQRFNDNGHKKIKAVELSKYFNVNVWPKCKELKLEKYVSVMRSPLEESVKKALDEHGIRYKWRNRSILNGPNGKSHGLELDFYFPEKHIAVEINDLANHSINSIRKNAPMKDETYHLHKTQACKEKGIRLIHIWEWELKKNFDKTVGWILNELNDNKTRIFARKCELKEVSQEEEKKFLDEYHLQGYSKSKVCLGLYFNDELVQLMSFADSRYDKKYQYELLRLCTKNEYIVVGGASRLFKYFIKKFNPESIISYCDYSKFSGEGYEKMGMTLDKLSKPTVYYCNFDMNVINESMLMKYGVDNLLHTNYGKGADNREMIMKHGYLPVYNCGNLIYIWNKQSNQ